MSKRKTSKQKITEEEIRQLVVERLRTLPSGKRVAIGSKGSFTPDELIKAVKKQSEIGKKIVDIELNFLRTMKEIQFYEEITPDN